MDGSYSNDQPLDRVGSWMDFAQRPRESGGLGLQRHQAAGVVGNLVNESGPDLNPWGPSGDNGTAWGTAQWRNDRLHGLVNFSRANGTDPRSMEAQQAWMRHELDTTHNNAYGAISQAQTPEEAATAFNHLYEISADRSGNREQSARSLAGGQPLAFSGGSSGAPPAVAAVNSAASGTPSANPIQVFRPEIPFPTASDTPAAPQAPAPPAPMAIPTRQSAIPPLPPGVTPMAPQAASQPAIPPLPDGVTPITPNVAPAFNKTVAEAQQKPVQPPVAPAGPPAPPISTPYPGDAPPANNGPSQEEMNSRQVHSGVQGAGRGIADFLGAPVDAASALLNVPIALANKAGAGIPAIQNPVGGSQQIANTAEGVFNSPGPGIPGDTHNTVTPESLSERAAYTTNRLGANAALTMGGINALPATNPGAAVAGPKLVDSLQKPYVENTGRTVAGDIGASAGAGAAEATKEKIGEYIPDSVKEKVPAWATPLLDFALVTGGATGGGVATQSAISVGKGLGALSQRLLGLNIEHNPNVPVNPATGKQYTKADVDQVAAWLQDQAVKPAGENADTIRQQTQYFRDNGGVVPTTGAMTGDVGVASTENAARVKDSARFMRNDQYVNSAARGHVDALAPEGANPQAFPQQVRKYAEGQEVNAQAKVDQAQTYANRTQNVREQHGQEVSDFAGREVPASQALDTQIVNNSLRPAVEAKNRRYAAIPNTPIEGGSETMHDAASEIRARNQDLPPHAAAAATPAGQLGDFEHYAIRDEQGNITGFEPIDYQTAERMRPQLSSEIAAARKSNASPELISNLERLRQTITGITNDHPAAAEANRFYQEDFAPVYGRNAGPAYDFRQDFNKDQRTRSASPPEKTAGRFIQPNAPTKSDSLRRIFDTMPDPAQAQAAARDYMMADMAKKSVLDPSGALRPRALQAWARNNAANLDLAPGFRDEVNGLITRAQKGERVAGTFADELAAARGNLASTKDANKAAFGNIIGADPTNAVQGIFGHKNPSAAMDNVLSAVKGEPAAIDGLKAAVRDYLVEKSTTSAVGKTANGENPVSFAKLDKIFNENEDTLSKLYSPQEMNDLRAAHKLLATQKNLEVRATTGSDTTEKMFSDESSKALRAALIFKYGALKAGGILKSLKLAAESLGTKGNTVETLKKEVWFNPELAAHLFERDTSKVTTPNRAVGSPWWTKRLFTLMGAEQAARDVNGEK